MEPEPSPSLSPATAARRRPLEVNRVRKRALEEALEQVHRAIEMLHDADNAVLGVPLSEEAAREAPPGSAGDGGGDDGDNMATTSHASDSEHETTQLCDLLKSKVESLESLQKLESTQKSVYKKDAGELDKSWDIIKAQDLWKDDDLNDGYVLVNQEDVVDGITSYMAAYLLSLKKIKELSPDQLHKALQKTFSGQKKKSKVRKAWDGTKVIYNVASWGTTAVGVYNNRALLTVATTAFRTSCRVVSKFL